MFKCPALNTDSTYPLFCPYESPITTKEARIYNGKKTTSLTSGVGKTGQPPVKE